MKRILLFVLLIEFSLNLFPQNKAGDSILNIHTSIKQSLTQGLKYLETTQRRETIAGHSYRGEWQTFMCLSNGFVLLGGKKKVDDSNCFSVAYIHNSLAKIYLIYLNTGIFRPCSTCHSKG